jgi:hypothetical protein
VRPFFSPKLKEPTFGLRARMGGRGDFELMAGGRPRTVTKAVYARPAVIAGVAVVRGASPFAKAVAQGAAPLVKSVGTSINRMVHGIAARIPGVSKLLPKRTVQAGLGVPVKEVATTATAVTSAAFLAQDLGTMIGGPVGKTIRKAGEVVSGVTVGTLKAADIVLPGDGIPFIETGIRLNPRDVRARAKQRGAQMGHPAAGTSLTTRQPVSMGVMPESNAIVRSWHANGVNFWRTVDGWIYVQRLDGTIKRYRPYKSVVLGKRPSSRQVKRAIRKLKGEAKIYRELTNLFKR